jgi:prepilin-type N-terminal cleavage/methylation domain-containing protein
MRGEMTCTRGVRRGFTLVELMIVVAIIAILAAIAVPLYSDYVLRGKLVDGMNGMTFVRTKMEQFYQDNRTYATTGSYTSPCLDSANQTWGTFSLSCGTPTATSYTLTVTGSGMTTDFVYTIDQSNTKATTKTPAKWGSVTSSTCWIIRKGGGCS